jgi:hypothetical protein
MLSEMSSKESTERRVVCRKNAEADEFSVVIRVPTDGLQTRLAAEAAFGRRSQGYEISKDGRTLGVQKEHYRAVPAEQQPTSVTEDDVVFVAEPAQIAELVRKE